jgi:hypothetical protein
MEDLIAYPFSIVGFVATNKKIEEVVKELTPEDVKEIQEFLAKKLFKENVEIAIFPAIVPVGKCEEAIRELEKFLF